MSVLSEIIAGVREDLATRRFPLAQIQELMLHAPEVIKPKFSKSNFGKLSRSKCSAAKRIKSCRILNVSFFVKPSVNSSRICIVQYLVRY